MEVHAQEFWLPKHGSSTAEYEDASRSRQPRFAVADGATETSFSRIWAKQLVNAFTRGKLNVPLAPHTLRPLQTRWQEIVRLRPLPWYAEEKAQSGAFAAFLGLELEVLTDGEQFTPSWKATAAGDTCLVQVRGGEVIKKFPLERSDEFGNRPHLLCSRADVEVPPVSNCIGDYGCDDAFFLMSDALALWFYSECESGNRPWEILRDLDTTDARQTFDELISDLRACHYIKNDDVTLLRIDVY